MANRGLFTALACHAGFQKITFSTAEQPSLSSLPDLVLFLVLLFPMVSNFISGSCCAGTLLRGQPYLSELAWQRGHRHGHDAYSLVGLFILAPPMVRERIGEFS